MTEKQKTDTVFNLGGKEVDASKALPLNLGQLRRLNKEFGVKLSQLTGRLDTEELWAIAFVVFTTANPDIKDEDVSKLLVTELPRLGQVVMESQAEEVDRPT